MNKIKGKEYFNVRYQIKPFMIWIWISTMLISFWRILSLYNRFMKNKILIISFTIFLIFCFFVFFKSLNTQYLCSKKILKDRQLSEFVSEDLFNKKKITSQELFKDSEFYVLNIWASWCAPCREEHPLINGIKLIILY